MTISIIKIQNVKSLKQSIDYILQEPRTSEDLISCYACDRYTIIDEFQDIYDERKVKWNRETKNKAKMLIQSFKNSDEVDPQLAHEIGKEYAENYLEGSINMLLLRISIVSIFITILFLIKLKQKH